MKGKVTSHIIEHARMIGALNIGQGFVFPGNQDSRVRVVLMLHNGRVYYFRESANEDYDPLQWAKETDLAIATGKTYDTLTMHEAAPE